MHEFELVFFIVSALCVLAGGLITVASRRPVRSAMGLLATIFGIAGCYLLLSAEFLAAIQLIVYAGAVVVLFIFVVMLLGSAAQSPKDARSAVPRYVAALTFLVAAAGAVVLLLTMAGAGAAAPVELPPGFGTIGAIGREVFTLKIVPFEITGLLLLVAVVGALAVARGKHRDPTRGQLDASEPPKALPPATQPDTESGPETAS